MGKKLFLGDAFLAVAAVIAGHVARGKYYSEAKTFFFSNEVQIALFASVVLMFSFMFELYSHEKNQSRKEILLRTGVSSFVAFFALSALYYALPAFRLGRGAFGLSIVIFAVLQFFWHSGYRFVLALPGFARRVLILGTGPLADQVGKAILGNGGTHVLVGYVNCASDPILVPPQSVISNGVKIADAVRRERADKLVVSLSERRGVFPLQDVLACKMSGVDVIDAPSFYEQMTGKLLVENTDPSWFIFSDGFKTTYRKLFKRPLDVFLSCIGLVLCAPLFAVVPLLVALDSKGPVLFRQVRMGEGEKDFVVYKFRTMREDAEKMTGAVWSQENDPRITRVGKFLRKTRLDEFPQLFNILKGDMSLVGPRPERPEFIRDLKKSIPYYSERHFVKPGLTGWAQVKYPYGASIEDSFEKLRYDLFYIKRLNFFLDLTVIIDTVRVVLFGRGEDNMRVLLMTILLAVLVPAALHAADGDYVIGDGDTLSISVWGEPSLSQSITVRPDGKITIPALGDVIATGHTPSELSRQLETGLKKIVKVPIVTVAVTGIHNSKVYVFGGGPGTGVHVLPGRTTLLKFLAGLGNLKEADLKKSYLMRDGKKIHSDFHDLFVKGDLTKDAEIEPGDLIFMPDNSDNKVYVMGAVVNPTFVVFRDNLSVLDAILQVGGFTEFAHRDKVVILRKESGQVQKIKANVEKVMKDGELEENIVLKKGDFVVVKESIF